MRRRWLGPLVVVVVGLFTLELASRLVIAYRIGPRYLLYGFVEQHFYPLYVQDGSETFPGPTALELQSVKDLGNRGSNYRKFFPNEVRYDYDVAGERFQVQINAEGFRGEPWPSTRTERTVRIVTIGGSSTFGYGSREEQTYPERLRNILAERCPDRDYQVINLGLPRKTSEQFLQILRDTIERLKPDLVVAYAGYNDARLLPFPRFPDEGGWTGRAEAFLRKTSIGYRFVRALYRDVLGASHRAARKAFQNREADHERFLSNLESLRTLVKQHGAKLLVATEASRSQCFLDQAGKPETARAEEEKLRGIVGDRGEGGDLSLGCRFRGLSFLSHRELNARMVRWAIGKGVPFVDTAQAVGPADLMSHVHPTPEANRRIAEQLAAKILYLHCWPDLKTKKIGEGLSLLYGRGGTIAVLEREGKTLLVDTGRPEYGRRMKGFIGSVASSPVSLLINTHEHPGHVGGNVLFPKAQRFAHPNATRGMAQDRVFYYDGMEYASIEKEGLPSTEVSSRLELKFGSERVRLLPLPPSHTRGDLAVHFVNADVLMTGDLFSMDGLPLIDPAAGGKASGILKAIDRLLAAAGPKTVVVPGHGPTGTRKDLLQYRGFVERLFSKVGALRKQGVSLQEARQLPWEMIPKKRSKELMIFLNSTLPDLYRESGSPAGKRPS